MGTGRGEVCSFSFTLERRQPVRDRKKIAAFVLKKSGKSTEITPEG